MNLHSTKTDNASIKSKIELRRRATERLPALRVLDLYAGNNLLWSMFKKNILELILKKAKAAICRRTAKKLSEVLIYRSLMLSTATVTAFLLT